MHNASQRRALRNYRSRLTKRGMARFEVLGLDADRALIRAVARRLAEKGPDAERIRTTLGRAVAGEPAERGGILAALRRSPLAGLAVRRVREEGRKIDL